jgi:hypothetical protein
MVDMARLIFPKEDGQKASASQEAYWCTLKPHISKWSLLQIELDTDYLIIAGDRTHAGSIGILSINRELISQSSHFAIYTSSTDRLDNFAYQPLFNALDTRVLFGPASEETNAEESFRRLTWIEERSYLGTLLYWHPDGRAYPFSTYKSGTERECYETQLNVMLMVRNP